MDIQLIHGDCIEEMKLLSDKSIDLVLADPPWKKTINVWDVIIPVVPMFNELNRVSKDNAANIFISRQPYTSMLIMNNISRFKYCWIWEKERPANVLIMKHVPGYVHADVPVFYKRDVTYNPIMEHVDAGRTHRVRAGIHNNDASRLFDADKYFSSEDYDPTVRYPRSVLRINREAGKKMHPTQKPVALMEYFIATYTNEGDTVLDFCMGSGTTAIACINLDRNFIGVESNEAYFDMAVTRVDMY